MSCVSPSPSRLFLHAGKRKTNAFTLIELLVVLAIIAVLATITLPSLQSVSESSEMSQAGQIVTGQIREARQYASAFNVTVQVRLIQTTGATGKGFNAVQTWGPANTSGIAYPVSRMTYLPQGMVISDSAAFSPILGLIPAAQAMSIPTSTAPASYVAFKIRSSGGVEPVPILKDRNLLYLTLVAVRSVAATKLPSNYFIVQLNPDTGIALTYRP